MAIKRGLGKGFGSLLPDDFDNSVMLDKGERIQKVDINSIKPDPSQPRKTFDKLALDELAQSIKQYGILQPLVVTEKAGEYLIIAGERRYRAAKVAGLTHLPVLSRTLKDLERLEISLIENVQRVDLSPMEQAISIARLNEQFNISLQEIGVRLGKAHTTIVNSVRLLQLPDFARKALEDGKITEGHARTVLSLKDNLSLQKILIDKIIKENWSVRQAENFVQNSKAELKTIKTTKITDKNDKFKKPLEQKFGAKIKISSKNNGGSVTFTYKTNKEFMQFLDNISK